MTALNLSRIQAEISVKGWVAVSARGRHGYSWNRELIVIAPGLSHAGPQVSNWALASTLIPVPVWTPLRALWDQGSFGEDT